MMQKGIMTELSTNHSQKLTSAEVMCYYNPITETNIVVNAGLKGLGTSLSKNKKNGQFKPTIYSSRALTDIEH